MSSSSVSIEFVVKTIQNWSSRMSLGKVGKVLYTVPFLAFGSFHFINADAMIGLKAMLKAIRQYLPDVDVSTIKDGQMQSIHDDSAIVDTLEDPPIIHAESVDAEELSMLLDGTELGADE